MFVWLFLYIMWLYNFSYRNPNKTIASDLRRSDSVILILSFESQRHCKRSRVSYWLSCCQQWLQENGPWQKQKVNFIIRYGYIIFYISGDTSLNWSSETLLQLTLSDFVSQTVLDLSSGFVSWVGVCSRWGLVGSTGKLCAEEYTDS